MLFLFFNRLKSNNSWTGAIFYFIPNNDFFVFFKVQSFKSLLSFLIPDTDDYCHSLKKKNFERGHIFRTFFEITFNFSDNMYVKNSEIKFSRNR